VGKQNYVRIKKHEKSQTIVVIFCISHFAGLETAEADANKGNLGTNQVEQDKRNLADIILKRGLYGLQFYSHFMPIAYGIYLMLPNSTFNIGYFHFGVWHWPGLVFSFSIFRIAYCLWGSLAINLSLFATYT